MRVKTVECETLDQAKDLCPWACIFAEVTQVVISVLKALKSTICG